MSLMLLVFVSIGRPIKSFAVSVLHSPMVIKPPPPTPVNARMIFKKTTSRATAHPRHPVKKVIVAVKKQARRPRRSEKRPYRGWKAVLVIKYEVVNQDAVLAALNSELMTAYVEAVIVPSKPARKTLDMIAVSLKISIYGSSSLLLFRRSLT